MASVYPTLLKRSKQYTVYVEYHHKDKRKRFATGCSFPLVNNQGKDFKGWFINGAETRPLKKGIPEYKEKNDLIERKVNAIKGVLKDFIEAPPDPEVIHQALLEKDTETEKKILSANILDYIDKWLEEDIYHKRKGTRLAPNTMKTRRLNVQKLKEVQPVIKANEVGKELYKKLREWCYQVDDDKPAYDLSTFGAIVKNCKVFFGWLQQEGISLPNYSSKDWIRSAPDTRQPVYLEESELQELIDYKEPLSEKLERIKDLFVFQCLTGLRVGDLMQVGKHHYRDGRLVLMQQKTKRLYNAPLRPEAVAILKKYNFNLPDYADQKYNEYIKELLEAVNLNRQVEIIKHPEGVETRELRPISEVIKSHNAVHTFISLALNKGVSPKSIETLIGKDVKTILQFYWGQSSQDYDLDISKLLN